MFENGFILNGIKERCGIYVCTGGRGEKEEQKKPESVRGRAKMLRNYKTFRA